MLIDKLGLAWRELGFGLLMPHLRHQKLKVGRDVVSSTAAQEEVAANWSFEESALAAGRKEGRDLGVPRGMLIMLYLVAWFVRGFRENSMFSARELTR